MIIVRSVPCRRGGGAGKRGGALVPALLLLVAAAGCSEAPAVPETTRPDWGGAAVDGIAPLMSPAQVMAALQRRGYRQVRCTSDEPLFDDPLGQRGAMPCYESANRLVELNLYFLDLHEGRRLAVANFRKRNAADVSDAARHAATRAYADDLRKRFGPPSHVDETAAFQTLYWRRPGGVASLPDMISTTIDSYSPPNVSLTSMWAYGEQRSPGSAKATPPHSDTPAGE
ncbi:hypothetical protein ACBY01_05780 [Sphingomonas sp. ac-8]|uniref:hypothetical protein n=1 Tax=Sphingomonas sp. ac-8 TaxID=3242977 RepID=UPI003A8068E2